MIEVWYRFENWQTAGAVDEFGDSCGPSHTNVRLVEFGVEKRTPKGAWLKRLYGHGPHADGYLSGERRFVLLSANKRFACPSIEEALVSFVARKSRQISILDARRDDARKAIAIAKCIVEKGGGRREMSEMSVPFQYLMETAWKPMDKAPKPARPRTGPWREILGKDDVRRVAVIAWASDQEKWLDTSGHDFFPVEWTEIPL